jgi:sugar-specific transcriptional regulator TrmB
MEEEEMEEEIPELNKIKKSMGVNRFDRIEKAMTASHQINAKYIKALGMMVKDVSQKLEDIAEREEELLDIIKSQEDTISSLEERLEEFGSSVPTPKSLSAARPVERIFAKGFDNEFGVEREFGGRKNNQVSMSKQANVVAEILDQATFAKGFDDEFSRAVTHFEASKTLPSNIIARIKNEFGIEIVK